MAQTSLQGTQGMIFFILSRTFDRKSEPSSAISSPGSPGALSGHATARSAGLPSPAAGAATRPVHARDAPVSPAAGVASSSSLLLLLRAALEGASCGGSASGFRLRAGGAVGSAAPLSVGAAAAAAFAAGLFFGAMAVAGQCGEMPAGEQ